MTVPSPPQDSPASYHQGQSSQQGQKGSQIFEFTKRKKWSNILLSEQPDTLIVILDYHSRVQYVGPGMREVLGWEVEELIETNFLDLVNGAYLLFFSILLRICCLCLALIPSFPDDDKMGLGDRVKTCLESEKVAELSCYTRLKCRSGSNFQSSGPQQSHKELLFEFRGRRLPDYDDSQGKLIILVAKPYPSRNTAM